MARINENGGRCLGINCLAELNRKAGSNGEAVAAVRREPRRTGLGGEAVAFQPER